MGLISRRPLLPAPTDSLLESADETGLGTDLGTDLSRRTDKTWEEIPGDGTPITISPAPKHNNLGKLPKSGQQSQTSLLIELFESSKTSESGQRRPSLRVRYTPSKSRKKGGKAESHILVTETKSTRKPSTTHRIALGGNETLAHNIIEGSISSLDSAGNLHPTAPVEIDVHQDDASDFSELSASPELRYAIPESDISSMPPESSLGIVNPVIMSRSEHSGSLPRVSSHGTTGLKPPVIATDRNASNERITQKVIEKLSNKPRVSASGKRRRSSQTASHSSISREVETDDPVESRAYATKNIDDDWNPSATGSSLLSGTHLSAEPRATDQRSVRSGASNVSITNNPKLLQMVEDTIRRLILPELTELRRDQRHDRSRHDKLGNPSDISSSTVSREERSHRKSSGSKSKRRVSRESDGAKPSSSSRRHRHHKYDEYDSPSEQSYNQSESVESSSIRDDQKPRKSSKSHRARDVAAGALGGAALTAAALKSHDSGSSLEVSEKRRRRRSKSRSSRSASVTEKDDVFSKHKVPPMPFVSEVGTDLTRSSLQSSVEGGTTTPTRREVRDVIRGSPLDMSSSGTRTPTRNNPDIKRGLGTHHGNFSERDLSGHDISTRKEMLDDGSEVSHDLDETEFGAHGFAALTDPERARAYERNLHQQHPIRRGLSPIQSVASYATTTEPNRNSFMHTRSSESLDSLKKHDQVNDQVSISTLSSPPSTDLARAMRPHGISLENRSEIMAQHKASNESTPRQMDPEAIFDEQHLENESYRQSPYVDKVTAGRHVAKPLGATAEFTDIPTGVESAVASLISNTGSPRHSHASSLDRHEVDGMGSPFYDRESRYVGSPLKQHTSSHSDDNLPSHAAAMVAPPIQSPSHSLPRSLARSLQHSEGRSAKSLRSPHLASGEAPTQAELSPESDITTNPSVIQGPIGGLSQGNTDHWPYDPTPPRSRADLVLPPVSRDIGSAGADLVPEALTISHNHDLDPKRDLYMKPQALTASPGAKDEGYETGANARSPGLYSQHRGLHDESFTPDMQFQDADLGDDPFTITKQDQYVDRLSHGMSPMFDGIMDGNREQIQSRDIVNLMDHLTVRDAQRNARDTEILVTLVRSAAEMRNSFEDMKKFIAEQDEQILDSSERHHEKTQRIVGGPRPQPTGAARTTRSATSEEDLPNKRGNVFRRALRGLGTKNTQELQNIEGMLMRLLDEVEGLRTTQQPGTRHGQVRHTSLVSTDNARAPTDTGYEPEGQAGTSSTGDQSGFFSNNSSRQADYRTYNQQRDSGNRVSTVMEDNEEYDDYDAQLGPAKAGNVRASYTPLDTPPRQDHGRQVRAGSVPLNTPPRTTPQNTGSQSNENTPHQSTGDGSGRKHKSFASNFIPKMVSRWSKTTASSADNFRSSVQKPRPHSEISRSGSNLGEYEYEHDPQGDDRLRSNTSFQGEQYSDDEHDDRPPSPLIPSQISDNPKYQAHRDSMNLQHPQPRQGPTGRFQSRLESEAQHYNDQLSPTSQTSSHWDQGSSLQTALPGQAAYGDHLSPIPDNSYSTDHSVHYDNRSVRSGTSSQGPPRPPKISNEEPLVPQRPPKVPMSPSQSGRQPTYVDHVAAARAGSPAFDKSPVAALRSPQNSGRKPSGPRPLTGATGSKGDLNMVKRTRFRGSPNQVDSDDEASRAY